MDSTIRRLVYIVQHKSIQYCLEHVGLGKGDIKCPHQGYLYLTLHDKEQGLREVARGFRDLRNYPTEPDLAGPSMVEHQECEGHI